MSFRRVACLLLVLLSLSSTVHAADRPNFLWILSEDNSKHFLKLFDETGAETPNIARLAKQGLTFNHAFSNAPVCSVARTTLITGIYAPKLGTHYHRKIYTVPMPTGWRMFPAYLNEAGYYTSNNSKKDYNAEETPNNWNESSKKASWRNRKDKTQPFFHMQTFTDSHESSLHFNERQMGNQKTETDPDSVFIPPFHPDTPTFRYTYARYHDRMKVIDRKVGQLVQDLADDGLLEETFIFYFGDHGGVLPGSKGYANERGLHIPLVVRVPDNYQHLVDAKRGSRVNGFVSFIDFGPTLLKLAGLDIPEYMDGKPFLGESISLAEVNRRDEVYCYADRFDEKYESIRTVRKGNLKYHRNYQSYLPDGLQNNYRYRMLAYQEWRELYDAGKLNPVQAAFFESKAPEALYDLETDPYETTNLIDDPRYTNQLKELREKQQQHFRSYPDLSSFPEPIMVMLMKQHGIDGFRDFSQSAKNFLASFIDLADLSLLPFAEAKPKLQEALKSSEPGSVYWSLLACCSFGSEAKSLKDDVREQLENHDELVKMQAAVFLAILKAEEPQPHLMKILKETDDPIINLNVLNNVVYLRDTLGYEFAIKPEDVTAQSGEVKRRLEYLTK